MTQVRAISDKYNDGALGKSMDQARQARGVLMRTVHDVNATETQVREAAANVALAESESAVAHHRMAVEISALLTADQRAKLADMFAHMEERHGGPPGGKDGL
jgi:Spy/CpxP family protein refolding chaperone